MNEAISVLPRISDAEIDVMEIVWNDNPIGTNEITDRLTGDGERSPKTIQTLIRRLVDKGALSAEKRGRQFYYTPAIDRDDFIDSQKTIWDESGRNDVDRSVIEELSPMDTEGAEVRTDLRVHGYDALMSVKEGLLILVWSDTDRGVLCTLELQGQHPGFTPELLLRMAESLYPS